MTRIFASALLLLLMSACGDCKQEVSAIVLDSATGQPLQGVSVFKKNRPGIRTGTDSIERFVLLGISDGFRSWLPMAVRMEFTGYQNMELDIPNHEEQRAELHK